MAFNITSFFKRRIKIIDRYMLSELFGPFILAICGFVIIGIMDFLFTLVDLFVNHNAPLVAVIRLLLFKVPVIIVLCFPMAFLFAVMLTMIRMAKDNELTVIRASGINIFRIILPIAFAGLLVSGMAAFNNEKIVPWTNQISNDLIRTVIMRKPPPMIEENVFFRDEGNRYFFIRRINSSKNLIEDIMMYEITGAFPRVVIAKTATWKENDWILYNGIIHKYRSNGLIEYEASFDKLTVHVNRDIRSLLTSQKSSVEMNTEELKTKIGTMDKGGSDTKGLSVDLYMKQAMPITNFVFGLVGAALCLMFVWNGKDWWGVVASVISAVLGVGFFFFLMALFRSFGRGGMVDPWLAAWFPNLLFIVLAVVVVIKRTFFK